MRRIKDIYTLRVKRIFSNPFYLLLTTIAFNCIIILSYLRFSDVLSPRRSDLSYATDDENGLASLKRSVLFSNRMTAKKLYEQHCTLIDVKMATDKTKPMNAHATGGFCLPLDDKRKIAHNYPLDGKLADAVADRIFEASQNVTVVDVGAGPGHYGARWLTRGSIKGYRALDAAANAEFISEGLVEWTDFTERIDHYWAVFETGNDVRDESHYRDYFWTDKTNKPRKSDTWLATSDWVISFEVLEHVPSHKERIVVDNLVSLTDNGIILSWAVPKQGGLAHVNERTNEYVLRIFVDSLGFHYCKNVSMRLRAESHLAWFKNTLFVFSKRRDYRGFVCE